MKAGIELCQSHTSQAKLVFCIIINAPVVSINYYDHIV